jgi:membrane protease YdiL (CAAX protease family)
MFSVAIVAIVLAYTWLVAPVAPRWTASVAGALVVALAIWRALKTGEWGLRWPGFLPALAWAALFTAAGALGIYLAGGQLGTWRDRHMTAAEFAVLIAWGFGQQFALQTVLLGDARVWLTKVRLNADTTYGQYMACALASLAFAALHLPNPLLAGLTFLGALAWCWMYERHPNVLPLALSHAVLTAAILYAFDDRITGRLRVGAAYRIAAVNTACESASGSTFGWRSYIQHHASAPRNVRPASNGFGRCSAANAKDASAHAMY